MEILLPGQANFKKPDVPIIGKTPTKKKINIPVIFYWEEQDRMTAAFKIQGTCFGESLLLEENKVLNRVNKQKLIQKIKDTLDLLVHHGKKILNSDGSINMETVNDMEAERFWLDKNWAKNVEALKEAMTVEVINRGQAIKLGLL
jgi:hypothetical protein